MSIIWIDIEFISSVIYCTNWERYTFKNDINLFKFKRYVRRINTFLTLVQCDVSCDMQSRLYSNLTNFSIQSNAILQAVLYYRQLPKLWNYQNINKKPVTVTSCDDASRYVYASIIWNVCISCRRKCLIWHLFQSFNKKNKASYW